MKTGVQEFKKLEMHTEIVAYLNPFPWSFFLIS